MLIKCIYFQEKKRFSLLSILGDGLCIECSEAADN